MKTFNKKQCKCGAEGKIWYASRWWCAYETFFGDFNVKGYCKKDKKNANSDEKQ